MVFSSIPAYLDPANWQQQPNHNSGPSSGASTQFAPPPQHHGSGGAGSIRPGSMADRARMANISMPEAALKCPRCESSNTKFCYFNNYSLSQPRHFCKTCRRYWTRGGALRNVPVGGGCRRNKRSKESSSSNNKSPVNSSTDHRQMAASGNSTSTMSSTNSGASDHIFGLGPQIPPLTFMTSFNHHLTADEYAGGADIGLNYGSLSAPVVGATANDHFNFHIASALASGGTYGGGGGGGGGSFLSTLSGLDQWRLQQAHQQFPFLDSTSSSSPLGLYGVDASGYNGAGQVRPKISSQLAAAGLVKMEENRRHHHHHHHQQQQQQQIQEMNLSRQFMGIQGNDQYWNTNTGGATAAPWTDISTFNSSSTGNPL